VRWLRAQTFGLTLSETFKRVTNPLRPFLFFDPVRHPAACRVLQCCAAGAPVPEDMHAAAQPCAGADPVVSRTALKQDYNFSHYQHYEYV